MAAGGFMYSLAEDDAAPGVVTAPSNVEFIMDDDKMDILSIGDMVALYATMGREVDVLFREEGVPEDMVVFTTRGANGICWSSERIQSMIVSLVSEWARKARKASTTTLIIRTRIFSE